MPSVWKVLILGNGGAKPRLSCELAKGLSTEQALELVDKVIDFYKCNSKPQQSLEALIQKMGSKKFKSAVLGE